MKSRKGQQRRVIEVASELFGRHGFKTVTMAEIAEAAGVARATVFNHFRSKHALIEAMTEDAIVAYRDMLDATLADAETPTADLIRRLFEEMGAGIESGRQFFQAIFPEIARIQLGLDDGGVARSAQEEVNARVLRLVERGQQRGELSSDLDAETLANAIHALSNGTIASWLYGDSTEPLVARMCAAAEVLLSPVELRGAVRSRGKRGR